LGQWVLIENDLADRGIDVESGILRERSARWLQVKIVGLLTADTRLSRHFTPQPSAPQVKEEDPDVRTGRSGFKRA
jgi:hypothetical protein